MIIYQARLGLKMINTNKAIYVCNKERERTMTKFKFCFKSNI